MSALLISVVLVFTPQPELFCEGHRACAVGTTVYMRGTPQTHGFTLDLDLVHFPHYANSSLWAWRQCGEAIEAQAGSGVEFNQLVTLCHEVSHVAGNKH